MTPFLVCWSLHTRSLKCSGIVCLCFNEILILFSGGNVSPWGIRISNPTDPNRTGMGSIDFPGGLLGVMISRIIPAWFFGFQSHAFFLLRTLPLEDGAHPYKELAWDWQVSMSSASLSKSLPGQKLVVGVIYEKSRIPVMGPLSHFFRCKSGSPSLMAVMWDPMLMDQTLHKLLDSSAGRGFIGRKS